MSSPAIFSPACLGGTPLCSPPLPMASPRLPDPAVLLPRWEAMVKKGQLTKGKELQAFESECAEYLGVKRCVGVSSCTSGLMLALQALRRGLPADVERPRIAVPSFTFMASVSSMVWAGFEPEFVEVDESSMNLCLEDLERVLQADDVVGVLAVHCFGNPVPTGPIEELCDKAGVKLLFDAAHAFGSRIDGLPVGQAGWCQVYSMTPTKMVVAGEGGMVATNDDALAEQLILTREYGNDGAYGSTMPGLNARLSELHCALGRESLKLLEEIVPVRNQSARELQEALSAVPGVGFQVITPGCRTTYKDYTVTIDPDVFGCDRNALAWALAAEGIPSRLYFSPPCHHHKAYEAYSHRSLPRTERLAARCLSIPLLAAETARPIAEAFARIQANAAAVARAHEER